MKNLRSEAKSIVVLGSRGFIGSHFVNHISKSSFNVLKFTSEQPLFTEQGDLTTDLHEPCDIFWFMSKINPIVAATNPKLIDEELKYFRLALKSLRLENENHRIIFPSSGGTIYGQSNTPCSEAHKIDPVNQYGHYKFAMEEILRDSGLPHTVLRISNVFGPNQPISRGQGVIAEWMHSIKHGLALTLYGTDEISRDFIFVEDLITALAKCISIKQEAATYNVGSGASSSLKQVLEILQGVTKIAFQVNNLPKRSIDRIAIELDISLAKIDLSWKPEYSLHEGIQKTWNSVLTK